MPPQHSIAHSPSQEQEAIARAMEADAEMLKNGSSPSAPSAPSAPPLPPEQLLPPAPAQAHPGHTPPAAQHPPPGPRYSYPPPSSLTPYSPIVPALSPYPRIPPPGDPSPPPPPPPYQGRGLDYVQELEAAAAAAAAAEERDRLVRAAAARALAEEQDARIARQLEAEEAERSRAAAAAAEADAAYQQQLARDQQAEAAAAAAARAREEEDARLARQLAEQMEASERAERERMARERAEREQAERARQAAAAAAAAARAREEEDARLARQLAKQLEAQEREERAREVEARDAAYARQMAEDMERAQRAEEADAAYARRLAESDAAQAAQAHADREAAGERARVEEERERVRLIEEEDARLARQLAQQENDGPPARSPPQQPPRAPQPPPRPGVRNHLHPDLRNCAGCGLPTWPATYITVMERKWHMGCFTCSYCGEGLLRADGRTQHFVAERGLPYHASCHKMHVAPKCFVCKQNLPERRTPTGNVVYFQVQPFWNHKFCEHHSTDGTPKCCACNQIQPMGEEFAALSDNRHICLGCVCSIVVDTKDCQPLYDEVLAFFRRVGLPHPERAPVMLVDSNTLREYSGREGKSTADGPVTHVTGLCLSTIYSSVPSIVRTAGSHLGVSSINMPTTHRACSVTAVLIMYGLPRLLTGCILAHELMHAWLRMKNVTGINKRVEEGLCQLLSYIWLDQQHDQLSGDPMLQQQASYFSYQIRSDPSEIYGEGFRSAYESYQMRGLTAVVNDVLTRGRFA